MSLHSGTPPAATARKEKRDHLKQHHPIRLRLTSLALALSLLLSGCLPFGEEYQVERTDKTFSQLEYVRPDGEAILAQLDQAIQTAQDSFWPFTPIRSIGEVNQLFDDFTTNYSLAQIHNYLDVTDTYYQQEMEYLDGVYSQMMTRYNDYFDALLNSSAGWFFRWLWDESDIQDQQLSSSALSDEILPLKEEENRLCAQYYYQYAQATVEEAGQQVLYSSLSAQGQAAYREEFLTKYNPQFGQLFLELVRNRDAQAKALGFENYVEVADRKMLRTSYTREDIQRFRSLLKQYLAPVYQEKVAGLYSRLDQMLQDPQLDLSLTLLSGPAPSPQGSWQDTMDSMEQIYSDMSGITAQCFAYMDTHEFIHVEPSPNKANVIFSTSIGSLNAPFLFGNMDNTSTDVFSISHEFGHCVATYAQQELGSSVEGRSMDVMEIHSQAMQFLTFPYFELFYGDQAELARQYDLYDILSVILSSAMQDEFQEILYQNPQMTLEELNDLYRRLILEYGLSVDSPLTGLEVSSLNWFQTNQFFDTPFYSIDYSLSGCVALELLSQMVRDYGQALETYLTLISQSSSYDFLQVLEATGLGSPFEESRLETLSQLCRNLLEEGGFGENLVPLMGQEKEWQDAWDPAA